MPVPPEVAGSKAQHQQIKESMERVVQGVVAPRQTGIDALLNYWPVIAAMFAAAVAWGVLTAQMSGVRTDVTTVLTKLDVLTDHTAAATVARGYQDREIVDLRDRVWKLEAKR